MKTKYLWSTVLALLLVIPAMAQQNKQYSLEDLMWGGTNYWQLQPKSLQTNFWGDRLLEMDVEEVKTLMDEKGKKVKTPQTLFTLDEVNAAVDTAKWGKCYSLLYASFPDGKATQCMLNTPKCRFIYDWTTKQVAWTMPENWDSQASAFNTKSRQLAYVKDWNLFVTRADGKTLQISTDGSRELQYGMSVHRDEFGISQGLFWSPKGNLLAFYRMDQSMVTDYPLVDIDHRVAQLAPEKYPMAGMTSHKVTVGIYNPATERTVYLQAGDPTDRYFTNIAWSPDESTVYMIELPRTQDKAELVAYDAATGQRKGVLYTETNARYVEPMHPISFLPWDDTKFIYQTRRDGYNHLYLFDTTGRELKQLTKGPFEVLDVLGYNQRTKSIIIRSNEASPIRYNHYSVNVQTGRRTLLDNGRGVHYARLSEGGAFLLDRWSAPDAFRRIDLVATAKPAQTELHRADSPYQGNGVPPVESGTI